MGDIRERILSDIWECPNVETQGFRKEFIKNSAKCRTCKFRRKCGNKNCRVEAMTLTGNWRNNSPYTCMTVRGYYE